MVPGPRPLPSAALLALAFTLLASASAAASGGAGIPPTGAIGEGGGAPYGQLPPSPAPAPGARAERPTRKPPARRRRVRRRSRGLVLAAFGLTRPRLFLYGRPARVTFRIEARARSVRVRLSLVPRGGGAPVAKIPLGRRPTGVTQSFFLTGRERGIAPEGAYILRISARDRRGRGLRRSARASRSQQLDFFHHRFPLAGAFSYGGAGSLFGAPRNGHRHQGQDLAAAEGTPIVAPRGGVVRFVEYQAGGAGHYAVVRGESEGYDYVFMHMRAGSVRVRPGQRVRTGQRIGDVGSTGSSTGAHLHFEIWTGGWFDGGQPIDPLPLLRRWDAWS